MKLIPSLAVLAVLVACGPAPELKRRLMKSAPDKLSDGRINLDKKTPAEVLKIKYNNEVNLECEFRAGRSDKLLIDIEPKKLNWNLVNATEKSKILAYEVDDRKLEVEISPVMRIYGDYKIPVNDPDYVLEHTPVVELTFRPLDNNIQQDPVTTELVENLPAMSFVFRFEGMINLLSCSLKTVIAPKYEVEFRRIEKKPETPAIAPTPTETTPVVETPVVTGPTPETEPAPVVNDQPSQASSNPSGQENIGSSQDVPETGTH